MKAFIIGAGFTGGQLARTLVAEGCHVVLIDRDPERVRQTRNKLDCTVIQSNGNSLAVLEDAGIASADALVTLTEDDEINMITCSLVDAAPSDAPSRRYAKLAAWPDSSSSTTSRSRIRA